MTPPNVLPADAGFVSHVELRQTEIENLGMAAFGEENVSRVNIAVNDAMGVRGVESIGYLDSKRQQGYQIQRTTGNPVCQRQSV